MNNALILGTFDGVHMGHRALLDRGLELKREGIKPLAVLFSKHPAEILGKNVSLLNTVKERQKLINGYGVDCDYIDFTPELSEMDAEDYIRLLYKKYTPDAIIVGRNHTFGSGGLGTPKDLLRLSPNLKYRVFIEQSVMSDGGAVSSTRIRRLIECGEIDKAEQMLGYRFFFSGQVEHGRHIGTEMGFPTANVSYPAQKVCPASGVYCVIVHAGGKKYGGVMNIGSRPTFNNGSDKTYECNLFNYCGDLYGQTITVEFVKRLRDEIRFSSAQELQKQIALDTAVTVSYFKTIRERIIY